MDFIAYNRAHLNNRRIRKLDDKVMVFVVPSIVQVGIVRTELRFPYEGELIDAYVTCGTMGESKRVLTLKDAVKVHMIQDLFGIAFLLMNLLLMERANLIVRPLHHILLNHHN